MKFYDYLQTFTCVKSIVTIALTACFIFLCVTGQVSTENFMTIYVMIIGFYFGTQWQKRNNIKETDTNRIVIRDTSDEIGSAKHGKN